MAKGPDPVRFRPFFGRLAGGEGVATGGLAAVKTAFEPGEALGRGAVGEAVGNDPALTLLLQPVVADGLGGGIERLFQIATLQHLLFSM